MMTDEGRANKQQLASNLVEVEQLIESAIEELEPRQPQWEQDLNQRVASGERHPSIWVDDVLDTGGTVSGRWDFVEGR